MWFWLVLARLGLWGRQGRCHCASCAPHLGTRRVSHMGNLAPQGQMCGDRGAESLTWEWGANLCRAPYYCSLFSRTAQEPPPPPSTSLKQRGVWQHRSPGSLQGMANRTRQEARGNEQRLCVILSDLWGISEGFFSLKYKACTQPASH